MLSLTPPMSEELANLFSKLANAIAPTLVGDLKMVVVNPNQKADTLMEIGNMTVASQGAKRESLKHCLSLV